MVSSVIPFAPAVPKDVARRHHRATELASQSLAASHYYELRCVNCDMLAGRLVLTGRVSSFYLKQIAQTIVGRVVGVSEVDNQLEVVSQENS